MSWHLPPGVTMTMVGPDVVFLDVPQDAYLCVPGGAQAISRRSYGLVIEDPDLAAELADAGLVVERAGASIPSRPAPAAQLDLMTHTAPAILLKDRLRFARSIAWNTGQYHGRSLSEMIALARQRGEGPGRYAARPPEASVLRQAMVFDRLLPWAPRQEACLYRSFMLLRFLGEFGRDANWVFGVRTRPFEAHCWIQAGPVVLNDSLDHVRSYAAILVT